MVETGLSSNRECRTKQEEEDDEQDFSPDIGVNGSVQTYRPVIFVVMMQSILVILGSAVGGGLRYLVYTWLPTVEHALPAATIVVNLLGSLALGVVTGMMINAGNESHSLYLLLGTGFCGGFTTLSAFSIETLHLVQSGHPVMATVYVAITVIGGVLAAAIGLIASRALAS